MSAGDSETRLNENLADYPLVLEELIDKLDYRPGWRFVLENEDRGQNCEGLTFTIITKGYNTYAPDKGEHYRVAHLFPVPAAAYNKKAWRRWLLDCLLKVESHECCEFFQIDGKRPYAPHHGDGEDPYAIIELGGVADAETSSSNIRDIGSQS